MFGPAYGQVLVSYTSVYYVNTNTKTYIITILTLTLILYYHCDGGSFLGENTLECHTILYIYVYIYIYRYRERDR